MNKHSATGLILLFCFVLTAVMAFPQDTAKKAHQQSTKAKPLTQRPNRFHQVGPALTKPADKTPAQTTPPQAPPKVNPKTQVDPAQLNDKTLGGQYQYLLSKAYNYQEPLIAAFWKNFNDTLKGVRERLNRASLVAADQKKEIDSLKASSASKDQSLSESNAKVDAISIFGIMMQKSAYNVLMFSLVGGLALVLVIVIITTAKYRNEARYRMNLYEEIEEEYKIFKAKANEKEIKLARELQTERNKLDELLGRG
ncbi:MAG: hypothetical protein JST32_03125 [Bacteroidetes bacterium]|nr:hypothetical protein [Bacteroidota bacterium]